MPRQYTAQSDTTPNPALMGLRTHKDSLQSAVNTFKHPDGRTVTLVGVEHIGEPEYFTQLRTVIDATVATGAQVRMESLLRMDDTSSARNDNERAGLAALNAQFDDRFKIYNAVGLDWVGQHEGLPREPAWILSDVHAIEMVRLLGPAHLTQAPHLLAPQRQLATIEALKARKDHQRLREVRTALVRHAIQRGERVQSGTLHSDWWERQTVYAFRECCEVLKVLEQNADVTVLWNPTHLRGFGEALLRNDFIHEQDCWLTVFNMPAADRPIPID